MYNNRTQQMMLHLMLLLPVAILFIYSYLPMAGIVIAFQKFMPGLGFVKSPWVGFDNFEYISQMPNIWKVIRNTVFIASMKIAAGFFVPLLFSLLLNEVNRSLVKRSIQTVIYLPHFLSWVLVGGLMIDLLSPTNGFVNQVLGMVGIEPIYFLGDNRWFPFVMVISDVWKEFGFGTILFMAALAGVDPSLYEAAIVDGAGRWKQTLYVTLPGILPISMLIMILGTGNILNAGFDQVFNLYSPLVYEKGDILDTLVFRIGITNAQYGWATAIGLFKSLVSCALLIFSYRLAFKLTGYRVF